jgi:hypothetical protein
MEALTVALIWVSLGVNGGPVGRIERSEINNWRASLRRGTQGPEGLIQKKAFLLK